MIATLALILASLFPSSAWGVTCRNRYVDWKSPHSICAEWGRSPATLLSTSVDGVEFVVPNPLRPTTLKPSEKPPEAHVALMKREFHSLVRTMTDQVAGDAPNGSLTSSRRYLVSRLASVSLEILPPTDALCGAPTQINARYTERTNTLQVCPLTARLPVAAWLPLFTHELGHLADPCNFRQGFAYTDRVPKSGDGVRGVVRECGASEVAEMMADGDHRADRAVALTPASETGVREAVAKLVACGALRPTTDPEIPSTYEGHPYFAQLQAAARLANVVLTPRSRVAGVKGLCDFAKADKETAADQIGFTLLAEHLRQHPIRTRGELVTYFYASVNCSPNEHRERAQEYASSSARIEALLRIPDVRALARCK